MANLSIKNSPKWYQKYHSQNTLLNPCYGFENSGPGLSQSQNSLFVSVLEIPSE
jgi:hypothetical protein